MLNRSSILVLVMLSCFNQLFAQPRIEIHIPSPEEEAEYLWRTIRDIRFFEQYNYVVNLPRHTLIDSLVEASRNNQFSNEAYPLLVDLLQSSVYQLEDYQTGANKIRQQEMLIHGALKRLAEFPFRWEYKTFDTHRIRLTLYGSGGSFNPDDGSLILLTTSKGEFRQYPTPANTIIHELIHVGIEESLIQTYHLPHSVKERMVDQIMLLLFQEELPNHQMQDIGSPAVDVYMRNKRDLKRLDKRVRKYLKKQRMKDKT